jgi:hypothetical protein
MKTNQKIKDKMTNNKFNFDNKIEIKLEDFNKIWEQSVNQVSRYKVTETVIWNKDMVINVANTILITMDITHENINELLTLYVSWQKENSSLNLKYDEILAKVKNNILFNWL